MVDNPPSRSRSLTIVYSTSPLCDISCSSSLGGPSPSPLRLDPTATKTPNRKLYHGMSVFVIAIPTILPTVSNGPSSQRKKSTLVHPLVRCTTLRATSSPALPIHGLTTTKKLEMVLDCSECINIWGLSNPKGIGHVYEAFSEAL